MNCNTTHYRANSSSVPGDPTRIADEVVSDWLVGVGHHLSIQLVQTVIQATLDFFKWAVNETERYLYNVDEFLRFRSSDRLPSRVFKTIGGAVWSVFSYLFRVLLVLSIEPTLNPIKHFPVVTVAGKFLLPVMLALGAFLSPIVGIAWAGILSSAFILLAPGLAGFLVWELKENWRLYRANRPTTLHPARIGHHGETMTRLLRPGFHSGTIPHLFRRWRRAEQLGRRRTMHTCDEELEHVAGAVTTFLEREFITLVEATPPCRGLRLSVSRVRLGVTRVEAEIGAEGHPGQPLCIGFELKARWLLACVREDGWLAQAAPEARSVVQFALRGLFKLAGVTFVESQVRSLLPGQRPLFDVQGKYLNVWPEGTVRPLLRYNLKQNHHLQPRVFPTSVGDQWPTLSADRLFFSAQPLTWDEWVRTWESGQLWRDARGRGPQVSVASQQVG